jgi:hypothetical protein
VKHRNVAKLLARLNAKTSNLTGGGGGGRGEGDTAQVVAAALGLAAWSPGSQSAPAHRNPWRRLALQVFCLKWWPDTACAPARVRVRHVALEEVLVPHRVSVERYAAKGKERIDRYVARAQVYVEDTTPMSPAKREVLRLLATWTFRKWRRCAAWPALPEHIARRIDRRQHFWEGFLEAVFHEFCHPSVCPDCSGEGYTRANVLDPSQTRVIGIKKTPCEFCEGRGLVPRSATRRARALTLRREDFEDHFERIYTWQLNLLRYAEYVAARALSRALDEDSSS